MCWFVLVCTCYLNLGEKARIPYPFFLLAAVSRRFLCWFVLVLELVCSGLFLFVLAISILVKKGLDSGSCDHMLSYDKK